VPANGYIGFITAQGFFIGLIFAVLKFDDPISLLVAALAVTAVFYMIGQVSVSYFVRFVKIRPGGFRKMAHEMLLDQLAREIQKREDIYSQVPAGKMKKTNTEPEAQTGEK